jgi:DNA ligase-1
MGMRLKAVNILDTEHERFLGIMAAGWIRELEEDDGRLHKERVLEKALMAAKLGSADAQAFLFNCYAAYNPFWVYGVRRVPETAGITGQSNPWPLFWALLEALRTRSVTGGNAREAIDELSQRFDSEEWNGMARRVLIKDLRCGVSEKTINRVVGKTDWRIPVFTCQLAQDSEGHPAKMRGRKRLEVKLDGVRVLAVVTATGTTLYSRNGKVFENFPHVQEAIESVRRAFKTPFPFVLDGEIVGESFQKLMRQAHRKGGADTADMVYHVFDIVPLSSFEEGHFNLQQHRRLESLEQARDALMETDCVRIMDGIEVDLDTGAGQDQLRRYSRDAVENGFEGIMIKDLDAPYQCKRSSHWMKWKPTITVDLRLVGFEEGTGRNLGRLGAFVCEGEDNGRTIHVNVGSGFADSDRDDFWTRRDQLRDFVVEVEADAVTQNQDGSWSLRFPRFLRFRGFEAGEKL